MLEYWDLNPLLTLVIFLPTVGALFLLLLGPRRPGWVKGFALGMTVLDFLLSLGLWWGFDPASAQMQFVQDYPWITSLGVRYHVGIDGVSLFMVLLTTFLAAISVLASWRAIENHVREYMICLLVLETGMLGVFAALDLVLFYVFWEGMLIPMYFLIGVWGSENRVYAAIKFVLFTLLGGVLMLVGILWLYYSLPASARTFDFVALRDLAPAHLGLNLETYLFFLFGAAFAIKVPLFPFHTWLPDAHTEAPTAGSILLAGVLLKMGAYGFIRFNLSLFPHASAEMAPLMVTLALIGILYGGACALWQPDLKKLVAYSSVSHLGFVILGIFVFNLQGIQGAILQMVNHGLSTGALFFLVGVIYERRHTRLISEYGGLWHSMPLYSRFFLVVVLSSIGLPGLNGFVGEFLVLVGSMASEHPYRIVATVLAAAGVILSACYLLVAYKRVFYGKVTNPKNQGLKDITGVEAVALTAMTACIVWLGIYPAPVLRAIGPASEQVVSVVQTAAKALSEGPNGSTSRLARGRGAHPAHDRIVAGRMDPSR